MPGGGGGNGAGVTAGAGAGMGVKGAAGGMAGVGTEGGAVGRAAGVGAMGVAVGASARGKKSRRGQESTAQVTIDADKHFFTFVLSRSANTCRHKWYDAVLAGQRRVHLLLVAQLKSIPVSSRNVNIFRRKVSASTGL